MGVLRVPELFHGWACQQPRSPVGVLAPAPAPAAALGLTQLPVTRLARGRAVQRVRGKSSECAASTDVRASSGPRSGVEG